MEKKFTSDEVPLSQILNEARSGKLQLPDFQRGWVWDDNHISSLLASISVSYPIGAVMTLQTGNPDVKFRPRPLEGVVLDVAVEPETLLLDGQQRTTSLYLALRSGAPVPTRDPKGNGLLRRYFADIQRCIAPDSDREEAIFSVPADGKVKNFRGEVQLDVSTRAAQVAEQQFPLDIVLDSAETMNWMLDFLKDGPGEQADRLKTWERFNTTLIEPFVHYQVPTIQLIKSTPKEAVCQVFEKVNTGGVSLTVFELLTATYAADDFNLRDDWEERYARLEKHHVLHDFAATDLLQIVTLLASRARRLSHLEAKPDDERAPAITCKRRDVLRLTLPEYQKWVEVATKAIERLVPFLHGEHIFKKADLPYPSQLVPLAAIFAILEDAAEQHATRQSLRQWFWCGVFGEMYGGSTETRFAFDVPEVPAWICDEGPIPRTINEAQFQAERLLTLRTRQSAAYKGLYALQMKRGGRDFRTGEPIDIHAYIDDAIDVHHIFPRKWCEENGISQGIANSVVNKTAIDARTNQRIGGAAPSKYLAKIEDADKLDPADLDAILSSHDIDPQLLRQDDFGGFFNHRFERLLKQIEEAMGKPVNRSADKDESPFFDAGVAPEKQREAIQQLIDQGEGKLVEFKSTGRFSVHTGAADPGVEWSLVKTLAGFMNANGGTLIVGVDDEGTPVGVQHDYPLLKKQDRDGWELWLTDVVSSSLGKAAAAELEVVFCDFDGCDVVRIDVGPAASPVFATTLKGEKIQKFMARVNNSTQELAGEEALKYQKKRWPA